MTALNRLMIRISGKPGFPGWAYVVRKTYKYAVKVPPIVLRAKYRGLVKFKPNADSTKFLFIGGLHRSGTSIVYQAIRSHPEIVGIKNSTVPEDEGQHLQSVYTPDSTYGPLFAFHDDMRLTERSTLVSSESRAQLISEWGRYVNFNKTFMAEKSPSNMLKMRFLQALFDDARFCLIVRHPIPTAMAAKKWTSSTIEELIEHWLFAHRLMLADAAYINKILWFRYEDFMSAPQKHLDTIWQFLGVRNHLFKKETKNHNRKYFEQWSATKPLSSRSIARLKSEYKNELMTFGYSLESPYISKIKLSEENY